MNPENLKNHQQSRREFVKNSTLLAGGMSPRRYFQKPIFFRLGSGN